jgi:hypothetical protein
MSGDPIPYRLETRAWRIQCNYLSCSAIFTALEKEAVEAQYRSHMAAKHYGVRQVFSAATTKERRKKPSG